MKKRALFACLGIGLALGAIALNARPGRSVYLPSGWGLAPVGPSVPTGDLLAGGAASPDGRWVAFASVGQGVHRLYLLNGRTGELADTADLGRGWVGLGWAPDSSRLFVSGGTSPSIHRYRVDSGKWAKETSLSLLPMDGARTWLAGLATDGKTIYVAYSAADKVTALDAETGAIQRQLELPSGASPYQVRLENRRLFVSLQGSAEVVELDPGTLEIQRRFATGSHPNDLLVRDDRLFVACGNEDSVDVFDLYSGVREERIMTRPWVDAPPGSTPHALALSGDGRRLFVANSDNNAVAVVDVSRRGRSVVSGFLPTAAYPSALAVTGDGTLVVGSAKGFGTGPNDRTERIDAVAPQGYPYIVTQLAGTLARISPAELARLPEHTRTVRAVSAYRPGMAENPFRAPKRGSNPIPSRLGDPSPIEHVLYIIKENRTYDQVFGDLTKAGRPYGNGDPRLTLFGDDVAPNHRALAKEFVLLDNLYASGEVSVDGHHWTNGAYVPDFMQRTWPQQYSGKGTPRLTPQLAATPSGRIWDQARKAGLSYRTYYYHTQDRANLEWAEARRANVRDYEAVDIFIREFQQMERDRRVPNLMVMALSEDHTSGTRAGAFTPKACVGSNDYGLGKIVEAISRSSLWGKFAIFVIEDDAQNGPDHVDSHRTVALAISPFTRNAGVDSTHYTTTSMLRSVELILGLNPMSQFDAAATPLYASFRAKADLKPYAAVRPRTDLFAKNPPRTQSAELAAIDFSEPDQLTFAQEIALNRDIWASVKGSQPYPGAVRSFVVPHRQSERDDD